MIKRRVSFVTQLSAAAVLAGAFVATAAPALAGGYSFTSLTVPSLPHGDYVAAVAINNVGQILLESGSSATGLVDAGYLYNTVTHGYTSLPLDPAAVAGNTFFAGLNDSGQIVGNDLQATLGTYQSFLLSGGSYTNVSPPLSRNIGFSTANGINNAGQIAGVWELTSGHEQGYLLSGGSYTTINVAGFPAAATFLTAINNHGQILGIGTPIPGGSTPYTGFAYSGGVFTAIGTPGALYVSPNAINDAGTIVGYQSTDPTFTIINGFVDVGGVLSPFDAPGTLGTTAPNSINNAGQIVGNYTDASGNYVAFLATPNPVPEPSALALLGTGLLASPLLGWGRRRRGI